MNLDCSKERVRDARRRHLADPSQIIEHLEVVGSDGQHVDTVDKPGIKLTRKDPAAHGQHHIIPLDTVASVEGGKKPLAS